VIEPRLRLTGVLLRGALFGVAAVPLVAAVTLVIGDHEARLTFTAVTAGFSLIGSIVFGLIGGFYWLCSRGDIRRWRDWRTLRGRYAGVSVLGPTLLRLAAVGLPLAAGALLLYAAVDAGSAPAWLSGR
jgi:hypothetical protein